MRKQTIYVFTILALLMGFMLFLLINNGKTTPYYIASKTPTISLFNNDHENKEFIRGTLVDVKKKTKVIDDVEYNVIKTDDGNYYVLKENLVLDKNDCVLETKLFCLRDHVLTKSFDTYEISGWVDAKSEVSVTGYHNLNEDGTVDYYHINDNGYLNSKYLALEYYETAYDSSIYSDTEFYSGGDPTLISYYPKVAFSPKTIMPEKVKALYLNAEAICDVDNYLELAKNSNINSFVLDIKDCYLDTQLAYNAKASQKYAPSTSNIPNSYEEYQEAVNKIKAEGYYLIGRITAFKDDAFANDHPEESLYYNGDLYSYGGVCWPSVYSFKMWEYNVALALESGELGFDEIQFDYVRFPEDLEDVDTRNSNGDSRSEIVTNFLRYATEYLHEANLYISADVFGEISGYNSNEYNAFVSYYGQFLPAISNVVDVVSPMPYPDHFINYAYGIENPWANSYELMLNWAKATYFSQEKTYDKAKCRTWILAQNSDSYGIVYDTRMINDQIKALSEAGLSDGYMPWNAASNYYKYEEYLKALD